MAAENKRCRGDGPSSSLLSLSGPECVRLSNVVISDHNLDICKFPMPNTFASCEELFPTAVAERLLVNIWRWGLKLLPI